MIAISLTTHRKETNNNKQTKANKIKHKNKKTKGIFSQT
jgi:hypothetical protein